ncbi:uncharacterized protein LOC135162017 [Diachasmimorpha longicaudata]|uniref:uncharacterized protein LOC135162017 n=1 Tax=Diachasmimorpha longicaudata TaxID=58733 RepID=UPI0030B8D884
MSYPDSPDDQLYLLELTVNSLLLTDEKQYECDKRPLLVKIKYLDLPIFVLSPRDFDQSSPSGNERKNVRTVFSSGISCLFGKRPKSLVREMQTTHLKIGIFCADETYPIAEGEFQLSGCLCDQVSMAMNDKEHLPKPFVMGGDRRLVDPGENPAGSIDFEFKMTSLGRNVITHYHLMDNAFVFRSDREDGKFFVRRLLPEDDEPWKGVNTPPEVAEEKPEEKPVKVKKEKKGKRKK